MTEQHHDELVPSRANFLAAAERCAQSLVIVKGSIETALAVIERDPNNPSHHQFLQQLLDHRETLTYLRDQLTGYAEEDGAPISKLDPPIGHNGWRGTC